MLNAFQRHRLSHKTRGLPRLLAACAAFGALAIALSLPALAVAEKASTAAITDSAAARALKKLPTSVVLAEAKQDPRKPLPGTPVVTLDEIVVTDRTDPADFVPDAKPAALQFRDHLERIKPLTAGDIASTTMCLLGLCGRYGPEGIPVEDKVLSRGERNSKRSSADLATQFRGTMQ